MFYGAGLDVVVHTGSFVLPTASWLNCPLTPLPIENVFVVGSVANKSRNGGRAIAHRDLVVQAWADCRPLYRWYRAVLSLRYVVDPHSHGTASRGRPVVCDEQHGSGRLSGACQRTKRKARILGWRCGRRTVRFHGRSRPCRARCHYRLCLWVAGIRRISHCLTTHARYCSANEPEELPHTSPSGLAA